MTRRTCLIADCVYPPVARDLCSPHYQKWRGKTKLPAATRLGGEVRKALNERDMTIAELASKTGLQDDGIGKIVRGLRLPMLTTVQLMAEALEWPKLLVIAEEQRRRKCLVCGKQFVSRAKYPERTRFCGSRCQTTFFQRERRGRQHDIAAARLRSVQQAVADFCRSCEPDGLCRDSVCPLRNVSPLPFVPLTVTRKVAA